MNEKHAKKLRKIRADLYALAAELSAEEHTDAIAQQVREAADAVPLAMPKEIAHEIPVIKYGDSKALLKAAAAGQAMEPLTYRAVCTVCPKMIEGATESRPCDNIINGVRCKGTLLLDR